MREKLIELLKEADRKAYEVAESRQLTHPFEVWEIQADHLIAHGVTIAKDTNAPSKWIPVTERLPEKDVLVLCVGAKGGLFLGCPRGVGSDGTAWTYVPNARGSRYTKYWTYLPEPPKGE